MYAMLAYTAGLQATTPPDARARRAVRARGGAMILREAPVPARYRVFIAFLSRFYRVLSRFITFLSLELELERDLLQHVVRAGRGRGPVRGRWGRWGRWGRCCRRVRWGRCRRDRWGR
jgi:hypothetical protein